MINPIVRHSLALILGCSIPMLVFAQKGNSPKPAEPAQPLPVLKRVTNRHDLRQLGYGGTLSVTGAPEGSISVETWQRNEVDISAEIEIHGASEDDLNQLAAFDTFFVDSTRNHLQVVTTGTHDRVFMKRTAKNFPKNLLGVPFKIDFKFKVPSYIDLEINAGNGPVTISGVEGAIAFTAVKTDAKLDVNGGVVRAVIGSGSVKINIGSRSWRGVGANIQLASGELIVSSPAGFNADIDATIQRSGSIDNGIGIVPLEDTQATARSIQGRAGSGGAHLVFTVAEGKIVLKTATD